MNILVTGGAGFIGSALIKKLVERKHDAVCFDLVETQLCPSIVGSITDRDAVMDAVKDVDAVLHLAAMANINYARNDPTRCVEVNVVGTHNIIEACTKHRVPLHFISTCCVYGNTWEHPSNEESICVPTEIYAVTKLLSEHMITQYAKRYDLRYNILRYGTVYGPGMRGELAVAIFINQAMLGLPITIDGTGEQTRCLIYIDDIVNGTVKLVESGLLNRTINLATDEELSILEVADIIQETVGTKNRELKFYPDRPGQVYRELIDITYAWQTLGWWPKIDFREGVTRTIEWFNKVNKDGS